MSPVISEVSVPFKGDMHLVKADFRFIQRAEQRVNLLTLVALAAQGVTPKVSDVAWVIYSALLSAGVSTEYHDVGDEVRVQFEKYTQLVCDLSEAAFSLPEEVRTAADPKEETEAKKKP